MKRGGFTLIELIVALSLSWLCVAALIALFMPMLQRQARAVRGLAAHGDAVMAYKGFLGQVAAASEVFEPPAPGAFATSSDVLSGCANYSSALPGRLDASAPASSFLACVEDGTLYLRTAAGGACPAVSPLPCAGAGTVPLARNIRHAPGFSSYFSRPRGTKNVVEVRYEVRYGDQSQIVEQTIAFEAASGGNQ